jgi:hypothetical protein
MPSLRSAASTQTRHGDRRATLGLVMSRPDGSPTIDGMRIPKVSYVVSLTELDERLGTAACLQAGLFPSQAGRVSCGICQRGEGPRARFRCRWKITGHRFRGLIQDGHG